MRMGEICDRRRNMKALSPNLSLIAGRDDKRAFGIDATDRLAHMYVVGKTGTGKSSFPESLVRQDIANGQGLALLDPHGDLAEREHTLAQAQGRMDIIYLDVPDSSQPFGFNPLSNVPPLRRSLAASGLIEALKIKKAAMDVLDSRELR
jgi:DNA helicase HerA-like ATPase